MTIRRAPSCALLASLVLSFPLTACGAAPTSADGDTAQTSSAITGGTPVSEDTFGSVMSWHCSGGAASCGCASGAASCSVYSTGFLGGCSGTMIADQWMLTAGHCANTDERTSGGGTALPPADIVVISADRGSMATADEIVLNPTMDVALVHLSSSITNIHGEILTTPIFTGTSASLINEDVYCQGLGVSTGVDSIPTYGTLRSALLTVDNATTGWISVAENSFGQLLTFGDSGTGCFLRSPTPPKGRPPFPLQNALIGVDSLEFTGFDDLVGADGFVTWATCILAGNFWLDNFGGFCLERAKPFTL